MVTFPVNATTSFAALFDVKGFGFPAPRPFPTSKVEFGAKETTVLVIGGGSAVGKLAIQYAKLAGIGTVIAIASVGRIEELKALSATNTIDRHAMHEHIRAEVKNITGLEGVEYIYDCVSWDYNLAISLLSKTKKSVLLTLHPAEKAIERAKEMRPSARVQFIVGNAELYSRIQRRFGRRCRFG
jgi:NADPH2:quinone reductase